MKVRLNVSTMVDDADIDGEREQQRHQRQRQTRELLPAVRPEPQGERPPRETLPGAQDDVEEGRQDQRGAEHQRCQHAKARDQRLPVLEQQQRDREHGAGSPALQDQPTALPLLPGARLRGRQHRHPDSLDQAGRRGHQRAGNADADSGEPPFGSQAELSRDLRAIEPAQGRRDVGQQRGRNEIAADQPDQACDQRQRHELDHQHGVDQSRRGTAGPQACAASAAAARRRDRRLN